MPSKSLAELEEMVGDSYQVVEDLVVEAGKVEEFARAVKDDNPVHRDRELAVEQGLSGIPAPLTFTRTAYFPRYRPDGVSKIRPFDLGFDRRYSVHGEQEYEYHRPVVVGDVLSGEMTLAEVYQREGSRGGTMTFAECELEYYDENDEQVVTVRITIIETAGAIEEGDEDD
jgi:peroxisomal enoyl-CoA hydratase 2